MYLYFSWVAGAVRTAGCVVRTVVWVVRSEGWVVRVDGATAVPTVRFSVVLLVLSAVERELGVPLPPSVRYNDPLEP